MHLYWPFGCARACVCRGLCPCSSSTIDNLATTSTQQQLMILDISATAQRMPQLLFLCYRGTNEELERHWEEDRTREYPRRRGEKKKSRLNMHWASVLVCANAVNVRVCEYEWMHGLFLYPCTKENTVSWLAFSQLSDICLPCLVLPCLVLPCLVLPCHPPPPCLPCPE